MRTALRRICRITTAWVTKFADYPIDLLPTLPARIPAGLPVAPIGQLLSRTGEKTTVQGLTVLPLDGNITVREDGLFTGEGKVRLALIRQDKLEDGTPLNLCSEAVTVMFE